MNLAIGIDPGYKQTGIVIREATARDKIIGYAVLSCPRNGSPVQRARNLANKIVRIIEELILEYRETEDWKSGGLSNKLLWAENEFVIEMPVFANNPDTFTVQVRLVEEVEQEIESTFRGTLREIMPTSSKYLAAKKGNASKVDVAEASPFNIADFPDEETWTTVADAWAHSLAAFSNTVGKVYDLKKAKENKVRVLLTFPPGLKNVYEDN